MGWSHATARTLTGSIAVAVVALSLAGCSTKDKPDPKASPGSTASSTSAADSGQLKDQSAAVLAWTPPAPVAKTEGKLVDQPLPQAATAPATAEIVSVQAGDASTVLTWQLSSATDIPLQGFSLNTTGGPRFWPDAVRLLDPVGKKTYAVNIINAGDNTHCVCSTFAIHVGPDPVRMTSEYPPLPLTVTSVSVRIPNFAPVDVPVTR
jgi:hypothetical protein